MPGVKASEFIERLRGQGILALKTGRESIRIVTHLDVSDADDQRRCVR
ncbi:MAG: hypothetical protein MZV63_07770 [Marinilabiliales bacterium]|nr:hypothetical protein [Marinilabiliales bacterium]